MKYLILSIIAMTVSLQTTADGRGPSMSKPYKTVIAKRTMKIPAQRIWEAMVLDYGEISNFSPFIYASDYENGSLKGEVGAERKCFFNEKGNQWSHEEILEIDHEQYVMKNIIIDAAKFPLNLDNSFAYYRVVDNGDGTATAIYEFRFRAKPSIMTGLMKGSFQKSLDDTLLGLEHYLTTGEVVNAQSGNWKEVKKQYSL